MPLYKTFTPNSQTTVKIWKITESYDELFTLLDLKPNSLERVLRMKSEWHQRGFLSVRHILRDLGYTDQDLFYDENGKPHLKDGKCISITHSFTFTGIIVSDKVPVGIDIEMQRDKILKIAHKFTPFQEYKTIANHSALISKLTVVWGAKESLYKIYGKKKLRFLENMYIEDFKFEDEKTTGEIRFENETLSYNVHFLEFEGFTCVYAY